MGLTTERRVVAVKRMAKLHLGKDRTKCLAELVERRLEHEHILQIQVRTNKLYQISLLHIHTKVERSVVAVKRMAKLHLGKDRTQYVPQLVGRKLQHENNLQLHARLKIFLYMNDPEKNLC